MDEIQLNTCVWKDGYFLSLTPLQKLAYMYIQHELNHNRDWLGWEKMAHDTGLTYDQCESSTAKFLVDRQIPRIAILEEQEG